MFIARTLSACPPVRPLSLREGTFLLRALARTVGWEVKRQTLSLSVPLFLAARHIHVICRTANYA